MKGKISILALLLAFATLTALASTAFASSFYDTQYGTYTEVQAAVAGQYMNGKVYSPHAYVYAAITTNLPSGTWLVVYYYFEWEDLNYNIHTYGPGYLQIPADTQAGQNVRINCPGLPSQVIYIYAEGQAGYDPGNVWDTPLASIGMPFN